MRNAFKTRTTHDAREWQLDVAEALHLRRDCVVIAGTGSGKTTPFLLPLLLPENKGKFALIVSPLLSLQAEQVCVSLLRVVSSHEPSGRQIQSSPRSLRGRE
jgi:superfamily II DNA helicase RecQ